MAKTTYKDIPHSVKERLRHQNLQKILVHVANLVPKCLFGGKETKAVMLRRVVLYARYLHRKKMQLLSEHPTATKSGSESLLCKEKNPPTDMQVKLKRIPGKAQIVFLKKLGSSTESFAEESENSQSSASSTVEYQSAYQHPFSRNVAVLKICQDNSSGSDDNIPPSQIKTNLNVSYRSEKNIANNNICSSVLPFRKAYPHFYKFHPIAPGRKMVSAKLNEKKNTKENVYIEKRKYRKRKDNKYLLVKKKCAAAPSVRKLHAYCEPDINGLETVVGDKVVEYDSLEHLSEEPYSKSSPKYVYKPSGYNLGIKYNASSEKKLQTFCDSEFLGLESSVRDPNIDYDDSLCPMSEEPTIQSTKSPPSYTYTVYNLEENYNGSSFKKLQHFCDPEALGPETIVRDPKIEYDSLDSMSEEPSMKSTELPPSYTCKGYNLEENYNRSSLKKLQHFCDPEALGPETIVRDPKIEYDSLDPMSEEPTIQSTKSPPSYTYKGYNLEENYNGSSLKKLQHFCDPEALGPETIVRDSKIEYDSLDPMSEEPSMQSTESPPSYAYKNYNLKKKYNDSSLKKLQHFCDPEALSPETIVEPKIEYDSLDTLSVEPAIQSTKSPPNYGYNLGIQSSGESALAVSSNEWISSDEAKSSSQGSSDSYYELKKTPFDSANQMSMPFEDTFEQFYDLEMFGLKTLQGEECTNEPMLLNQSYLSPCVPHKMPSDMYIPYPFHSPMRLTSNNNILDTPVFLSRSTNGTHAPYGPPIQGNVCGSSYRKNYFAPEEENNMSLFNDQPSAEVILDDYGVPRPQIKQEPINLDCASHEVGYSMSLNNFYSENYYQM